MAIMLGVVRVAGKSKVLRTNHWYLVWRQLISILGVCLWILSATLPLRAVSAISRDVGGTSDPLGRLHIAALIVVGSISVIALVSGVNSRRRRRALIRSRDHRRQLEEQMDRMRDDYEQQLQKGIAAARAELLASPTLTEACTKAAMVDNLAQSLRDTERRIDKFAAEMADIRQIRGDHEQRLQKAVAAALPKLLASDPVTEAIKDAGGASALERSLKKAREDIKRLTDTVNDLRAEVRRSADPTLVPRQVSLPDGAEARHAKGGPS